MKKFVTRLRVAQVSNIELIKSYFDDKYNCTVNLLLDKDDGNYFIEYIGRDGDLLNIEEIRPHEVEYYLN
jgi:acyl-coenzyme A synthetase/AMP-(fatty) acid ligase